jgi:predicted transcriptional regulator
MSRCVTRLVDQVGQVRAGHPGGGAGHLVQVDVVGERHAAGVHPEDRGAAALVGRVHGDGAVEAAGPQQRGVEDIGPVGGGQDDDTLGAGEAVHLRQDLVEGLLALVVAAEAPGAAAGTADGVDLVDEDDRGRDLAGLVEQLADPAGGQDRCRHFRLQRCRLAGMTTTTIRVDRATHEELKRLARERHSTVAETVARAVRVLRQEQMAIDLAQHMDSDETEWLDADLG